nr:MAG TPA: hypothetical protein [Caudoviricetes sp.]
MTFSCVREWRIVSAPFIFQLNKVKLWSIQ